MKEWDIFLYDKNIIFDRQINFYNHLAYTTVLIISLIYYI